MKNLKYFIALVICSLGLKQNVFAQTYDLFFQEQYSPDRSELWVDVMIKTTGGGSWSLASANFVVNFDETELDYLGRDVAFDGPWDNGLNPAYYLDMSSNGIKILGDSCVNITVNPITSACPPTNGVEVPSSGVRIARLRFKIGTCGNNPGIQWKTGIGTGTINKWNSSPSCTATNIKANANFINPPAIDGFTDNDPVCADGNYILTINNPQAGYVYRAYKNGDYSTELGTWVSPTITIPASSLANGDDITVRGIKTSGTDSTIYVVGCFDDVEINPAITSVTLGSDSSVCGTGTYPIRVTLVSGGTAPYTLHFDRTGDMVSDTTIINYVVGNDMNIFFGATTTYNLVTITDANGCLMNGSPIDAVTITVNTPFSFSPASPASACLNDIVHVTLNTTVPGASWSVSPASDAAVVLSNNDEAYIQFKSGATTVTVSVTDGTCTINHNINVNQTVKIDLDALLNGANDGAGGMNANIITELKQVYENGVGSTPYAGGALLGALGTSGATVIPNDGGAGDAVDVVQIELRDQSNPATVIATTYGFIMTDGDVRDFPGGGSSYAAISDVHFCGVPNGDYYVVVKHRNHLPIMSVNPITLTNSNDFTVGVATVDLTNPANVYNSSFGGCRIDAGKAYMWEGNVYDDALASDLGEVNATDFFLVSTKNDNGSTGYVTEDIDLDGDVDATDFNLIQNGNNNLYFTDIPFPQLN